MRALCALFSICLSLLAGARAVSASVPDPALCTIPNIYCQPTGGHDYVVTILGSSGPVDHASVTLIWSTTGDTTACWCTGQTHPTLTAVTNGSGIATFEIAGGGCLDPATIPGGVAISVYVNSLKFKEVGQVSPDVVSAHSPPCSVTLTDAVNFTGPLSTASYSFCYDLDSDGFVGLTDAVIFTPAAAGAFTCN